MSLLGLYTYDDDDADACYACGMTWPPGDGERHRSGCYRVADPAGAPEPGTCFECGATEYANGACSNEGACRRWRDFVGEMEAADFEPISYGERVAGERELWEPPF